MHQIDSIRMEEIDYLAEFHALLQQKKTDLYYSTHTYYVFWINFVVKNLKAPTEIKSLTEITESTSLEIMNQESKTHLSRYTLIW